MELVGMIYGILAGIVYICWMLHKEEPGLLTFIIVPPALIVLTGQAGGMILTGFEFHRYGEAICGIFLLSVIALAIYWGIRMWKNQERNMADKWLTLHRETDEAIDKLVFTEESLRIFKTKENWLAVQRNNIYEHKRRELGLFLYPAFNFKSNQEYYEKQNAQYIKEREEKIATDEQAKTGEAQDGHE